MQPWIRFSPNSLHCQSWTYALVPCPGFSLLNRYPSYKHCQRGFPTTKVLPPTCTELPRPPPQRKPTHGTPHHSPARKRLKSFGLPDAPRPPPSRGASAPRTAEDSKGVPAGSWCLPAPGRAPAGPGRSWRSLLANCSLISHFSFVSGKNRLLSQAVLFLSAHCFAFLLFPYKEIQKHCKADLKSYEREFPSAIVQFFVVASVALPVFSS